MQRDYDNFGKDAFTFEIVTTAKTHDEILNLEELLVSEAKNNGDVYNVMGGGKKGLPKEIHPMYNKHHTKETKNKISQSKMGHNTKNDNHFYGKTHTDESKEKMSLARTGKATGKDNGFSKRVYVKGVIYDTVKSGREASGLKRYSFESRLKDPNNKDYRYIE